MAFNLSKVGAPAFEAVTTAEAKTHMRVGHSADDTYIGTLVVAAREQVEKDLNAAVVLQEYDLFTEAPLSRKTALPRQPAASVTSVKYTDAAGAEQTVDSANYSLKAYRDPPEVELNDDYTIPSDASDVVIRFKAGYADANSVPKVLKQAILLLTAVWYFERSAISELAYKPVPAAYERIIRKARVSRFR